MDLPCALGRANIAWSDQGGVLAVAMRGVKGGLWMGRRPVNYQDFLAKNSSGLAFFAGDLLDEIDDAPAQLGVGNAHECLGQ